ncbi:MAG: VCBS repeat-containing protein, partial [Deltaproteobacteria bacterium]|nr:VCBS repeat-containing protein [Deltaproteobacteria bacterium]
MKIVPKKLSAGVFGLLFLVLAVAPAVSAAPPVKVAILPFAMNAKQDLSYLRDGIVDMLTSRISWEGKVEVIEKGRVKQVMGDYKGPLNMETASRFGRELGADHVLFGSVTIFGESVSLDATMAALTKDEPPVTIFAQTQGMESVIPEVNRFARMVNAKALGRPYQDTTVAHAPAAPPAGRSADTGASALNPQFRKYQQSDLQSGSFWKSRRIKAEVYGMGVGDVTGDGQNELILVEGIEIHVYRLVQGSLQRVAKHKSDDRYRFISVDVADINKNGRAEIFASKFNEGMTSVASTVLEMKGKELVPIVKNSPWFYRVMTWPRKGEILVGQEKGRPGDVGGRGVVRAFFDRTLFRLTWNGSAYAPAAGEPLFDLSPKGLSSLYIYNFTPGDVSGDGSMELVTIDHNDNLRLLDVQGEQLEKTSEHYGGTLNYIVTNPNWDETKSRSLFRKHLFIPARIAIADLDGDGKNEIIINQNKSSTYGLSERFNSFSEGKIVSLSWDGVSLQPNWESRKINGCLSDYKIKDLDNDGRVDLVVAMLQKRGATLVRKPRSLVVSYPLDLGQK